MQLLTPAAANPKLAKGGDLPIIAAILHLAPGRKSGYEHCPMRSPGCTAACLDTAGRGWMDLVQQARIARSKFFHDDRPAFLQQVCDEIDRFARKAMREGKRCAIRLNGTSDILWERIPVVWQGTPYSNVMAAFPAVMFYDYTKIPGRVAPSNYVLTFSLSENNDQDALAELARGRNVAVVLAAGKTADLPAAWSGLPVIDGDAHDFRFLDPQGGQIIGLRAKGEAKQDATGFVRPLDGRLEPTRVRTLGPQLERTQRAEQRSDA